MSTRDAPIDRPAARVVLLDPVGRVLLFSSAMPDGTSPGTLWVPPGGALEPGEDWPTAAARELREETGLAVTIGPCMWVREHVWYWAPRAAWIRSIEHYFLARTEETTISSDGWSADERRVWTSWRWWTTDELAATTDVIAPRALGHLLADVLAGRLPATPMTIGE